MAQRQPHVGDTLDDVVTRQVEEAPTGTVYDYVCHLTPQMTNPIGMISYGVLSTLITEVGSRLLRRHKRGDVVVENLSLYFLKPVQIESKIEMKGKILEVSRKSGKVDVELYSSDELVGKGS